MNTEDRNAIVELAEMVAEGTECTLEEMSTGHWIVRVSGSERTLDFVVDPPGAKLIIEHHGRTVKRVWPDDDSFHAGLKILAVHIDELIATMNSDRNRMVLAREGVRLE
ncbi:hypothetical protein [Mycobacteroides abscessus]|uniref:hypothetical protein n=1 Tax=Mycobacteroides abscessus TaxID=36809 RepID=UPI000941266D|nr:hypothetical protein [Mycobacteroides abscessus]MBN7450310.1 hypothetical protein [Mycobacteroides abscessus subsp. abscessus]MDM2423003.1 hypothetical protein [Mycobacteroides abscessus]MDM2428037.1 hypothetical protein [Mycobacteroides abscessus]MDM2433058.1 hypothetical protein [Mycobacteroides abscessus]MDM2437795.1 hypothetical protein [Mycobacteroides abscessus]